MRKKLLCKGLTFLGLAAALAACRVPALVLKSENRAVPARFAAAAADTTNAGKVGRREFFTDPHLYALIDTALQNNQELNITRQEIGIARNEIRARQGEYLPFVRLRGSAGVEKLGRYTLLGASESNSEIKPGKAIPEPLPNYLGGAFATWEVDIWHRLRNARKAAVSRYLASVEGRNFMVTNLVAEIATSYYELLALDTQLNILRQNIDIQSNALSIVRQQKEATRVTELAVRRFEAQVLNTQSRQYAIRQRIVEIENRINFLVGRFPQPVARDVRTFEAPVPVAVQAGLPAQLLANRPDVRQADQQLAAAKLDVQVARARFLPSLGISANLGYQAFNPAYLLKTPESLLFSLAGDVAAPLVNRNAIKAAYASASAAQVQAVYHYERTVLNGYVEVANQLSNLTNLENSYVLKAKEVEALTQSIAISNTLFNAARADYMEVLLTQRDALDSKFDLVETKLQQLNAVVNVYRALGGGWN